MDNLNEKRLYIISRESLVEARRLCDIDDEARVLLVGRGLFLPIKLFDKKKIYAISEEVREQGLEGFLDKSIKIIGAQEVVDMILSSRVLNFS